MLINNKQKNKIGRIDFFPNININYFRLYLYICVLIRVQIYIYILYTYNFFSFVYLHNEQKTHSFGTKQTKLMFDYVVFKINNLNHDYLVRKKN